MEEHIHGGTCRGTELDFSVNINPLGMPEGCMEAAGKALLGVPSYPDTCHDELIRELSLRNGGHHVILGNGSCELIYALCHYLGHRYPGYLAYTLVPTFTEYRYAVSASGGRNRFFYTGAGDDFALAGRIDEFIDMIKSSVSEGEPVKLVFLCNPNNPTGELIKRDRIEKAADELEGHGIILAVDECFLRFNMDYEETTMTGLLDKHKNVVVLDAFTKFHAMPGLRLGYALSGDEDLLYGIREGIQPWNVSDPACAAALCALKDRDYAERTVKYVDEQRAAMTDELKGIGIRVIGDPSGPFIMIKGPSGLKGSLKEAGIDIRDCSDMMEDPERDTGYYRIAVRTCKDNRILTEKIREILA